MSKIYKALTDCSDCGEMFEFDFNKSIRNENGFICEDCARVYTVVNLDDLEMIYDGK